MQIKKPVVVYFEFNNIFDFDIISLMLLFDTSKLIQYSPVRRVTKTNDKMNQNALAKEHKKKTVISIYTQAPN